MNVEISVPSHLAKSRYAIARKAVLPHFCPVYLLILSHLIVIRRDVDIRPIRLEDMIAIFISFHKEPPSSRPRVIVEEPIQSN